VPPEVPPEVPAEVPAAEGRRRKPTSGVKPPPYLTGGPAGWRFQIRLPASLFADDFRLAGVGRNFRVTLGPRGRGEARRLAQQCATLCQTVFALAAATKEAGTMVTQSQDQHDHELAKQVIAACQSAIARAVARPSQAIGLAHDLDAALTSLRLVQTEVGKGKHGARAVVDNAEALTRNALKDVLAHASDPKRALEVLATTPSTPPSGRASIVFWTPTGGSTMSARPRTLRESIAIAPDATPAADPFGAESQEGKEAAEVARRGVLVRVSPETCRALKLAAITRGTTVQSLMLAAITIVLEAAPAPNGPRGP
jgi:hypothetical protein